MLTLLAHCGAKWWLCDGGSGVALVLIAVGVLWAGKRAERKAKEKRAAFAAARGYAPDAEPQTSGQRRRRPPR